MSTYRWAVVMIDEHDAPVVEIRRKLDAPDDLVAVRTLCSDAADVLARVRTIRELAAPGTVSDSGGST